jgi:hypothetical protein
VIPLRTAVVLAALSFLAGVLLGAGFVMVAE